MLEQTVGVVIITQENIQQVLVNTMLYVLIISLYFSRLFAFHSLSSKVRRTIFIPIYVCLYYLQKPSNKRNIYGHNNPIIILTL